MRISDWSSDVCSSDLIEVFGVDAETEDLRPVVPGAVQHDGRIDAAQQRSQQDEVPLMACRKQLDEGIDAEMGADLDAVGGADEDQPGEEVGGQRSEEHTSELQSLMRISYAVFCLKKK